LSDLSLHSLKSSISISSNQDFLNNHSETQFQSFIQTLVKVSQIVSSFKAYQIFQDSVSFEYFFNNSYLLSAHFI